MDASHPQVVVLVDSPPRFSPMLVAVPAGLPARSGLVRHVQACAVLEGEGGFGIMHCPFCRHPDSRVVDSRTTDDGCSIRRRRQCPDCSRRFTTVETASLMVIKRSGVTEPFSRDKVIS